MSFMCRYNIMCTLSLLGLLTGSIWLGRFIHKTFYVHVGERLKYPPALKKKGLQPIEFKKLVMSKLARIFACDEENLKPSVIKSIDDAEICCCITECITKPGNLDQRKKIAILQMAEEGFLIDIESAPSSVQSQRRHQGSLLPNKGNVRDAYHKKQWELYERLYRQNKLNMNFNKSGYFLKANGEKCTTEEMCNIVDGITQTYVMEDLPDSTSEQSQVATQNDREALKKILGLCKSIVLGRTFVDWVVGNNILSNDGYKQWKEHVWALTSFASLLVILDVLSKSPQYGSNSLLRIEM